MSKFLRRQEQWENKSTFGGSPLGFCIGKKVWVCVHARSHVWLLPDFHSTPPHPKTLVSALQSHSLHCIFCDSQQPIWQMNGGMGYLA